MYSTNLRIFSFYLAFAPSLCFYFLFIYFLISVKPCLLIYGIILLSSCVASSLSEGEGNPRKPGRMLSLPLPGSVWRTKSSADRNCPWPVPDNVLHQLMPGDCLLQDNISVCCSILYIFFFFIPHFLLVLFIFPYFTDASFFITVLSIFCECVLLILSHSYCTWHPNSTVLSCCQLSFVDNWLVFLARVFCIWQLLVLVFFCFFHSILKEMTSRIVISLAEGDDIDCVGP